MNIKGQQIGPPTLLDGFGALSQSESPVLVTSLTTVLTYLTSMTYGGRGYVDSQHSSVWWRELKAAGRAVPSEAAGRCLLLLAFSFLIQSDSVALGMCPQIQGGVPPRLNLSGNILSEIHACGVPSWVTLNPVKSTTNHHTHKRQTNNSKDQDCPQACTL